MASRIARQEVVSAPCLLMQRYATVNPKAHLSLGNDTSAEVFHAHRCRYVIPAHGQTWFNIPKLFPLGGGGGGKRFSHVDQKFTASNERSWCMLGATKTYMLGGCRMIIHARCHVNIHMLWRLLQNSRCDPEAGGPRARHAHLQDR